MRPGLFDQAGNSPMKRHLARLTVLGAMAAAMALAQTAPEAPAAKAPEAPSARAPAAQAPARARSRKEMLQSLDLTVAQKQQARTIFRTTRRTVQPLAQQLQQDRQSLQAAVQAGDTAQIQQLSTAMGTLHGQMLGARSAGMAQFYALLTPDQKAKAAQFDPKGE
jgi:Spy/CpxP family protein refolding chaperone